MTIPATYESIEDIHLMPGWTIQNTLAKPEPDIAPNPPAAQGLIQNLSLPNAPGPVTIFYAVGQPGKYCGWLSAQHLPVLANTGNFALSFDLFLALEGQAAEFDFVVTIGGITYSLCFQVVLIDSTLEIGTEAGGWQPAFATLTTRLTPFVWHHFDLQYTIDVEAKTCNVVSATIDGEVYPVKSPAILGASRGWGDGIVPQVQMDTPQSGDAFAMCVANMVPKAW